jgi:hydroxypyruvate isomerase
MGAGEAPFARGLCDPANAKAVTDATLLAMDHAAKHGWKNVITFTGMRTPGINDEQAAENVVKGLKALVPAAEARGLTLCLENLNSRVTGDNDRGHPGYYGAHLDYCADIVYRVGSPHVKLLLDIYHAQVPCSR